MKDLSISETQIMREVWSKKEDIAVPDLTDIIYKKYGKEHKPSTMRTFLGRLMEKEYLTFPERVTIIICSRMVARYGGV